MAGAFGGDDDRYSEKQSDEDLIGEEISGEDLDDEDSADLDDEDNQTDQDAETGDEEEENDDQEEPDEDIDEGADEDDGEDDGGRKSYFQRRRESKAYEIAKRTAMQTLIDQLKSSHRPMLLPQEVKLVEGAKKHKVFKLERIKVNTLLGINKMKAFCDGISGFLSSVPGQVILLIIIIAIPLIAMIASGGGLAGNFFSGTGVDPSTILLDSNYSLKYQDFYGIRTVYYNKDEARAEIIIDFDNLINDISKNAFEDIVTDGGAETTLGGKHYVFTGLTLNTDLKDADDVEFDFTKFANTNIEELEALETTLKEMDANRYNAIKALAILTNEVDNGGSIDDDVSLIDVIDGNNTLPDIKYFGLGSKDGLADLIKSYIATHYTFVSVLEDEIQKIPNDFTLEELKQLSNSLFGEKVVELAEEASTQRTEKLFIKDYLVNSKDQMETIEKQDYLSVMFMPKNDVTYDHVYMLVVNPENDFSSTLQYNSNSVNLKRDDKIYRINDLPNSKDDTTVLFLTTGESLRLTTSQFDIGDDPEYLKDKKSLISILRDDKQDTYLQMTQQVYTFGKSGLVWTPTNEVDGQRKEFRFTIQEVELTK